MKKYKIREQIGNNLVNQLLHYRDNIKPDLYNVFDDIKFNTKLSNENNILETLERLKETQEPIGMFSDCDSDGVNSAIVFYWALKDILNIKRIIICERKNGYGIQKQYYDTLKKYGIKYVFSADIGITSKEEVEYGKTLGIQSFITDHHPIQPELKPNCTIINPKLGDEYWMDLCGCGIIYVLMKKFYSKILEPFDSDLRLLHHCTTATIGDMVSLTGVNRLIVKEGLSSIENTKSKGLKMILDKSYDRQISTSTVSFGIVPMINSMNRIGDIYRALEFFLTEDNDKRKELYKMVRDNNEVRKLLQHEAIHDIKRRIENKIKENKSLPNEVLFVKINAKQALCGLVSSWITNQYGIPSIVVTLSEDGTKYGGSGRGCGTFDGLKMIQAVKGECLKIGGHSMAFGVSISSNNTHNFTKALHKFSIENKDLFKYVVEIDKETNLIDLDCNFVEESFLLSPYGMGNPAPLYIAKGVQITAIRDNTRHTFLTVDNVQTNEINNIWEDIRNERDAVLFHNVITDKNKVGDLIDIVFSLSRDGTILINDIL